jgi:iron complex transport system ATP-binding protein
VSGAPAAAGAPRLTAEGVTCAYGSHVALRDFDLAVVPGTVTALLGANGAGKSTALRALARLLRPRSGRLALDGRDLGSVPRRELARQLAFVPQSDAVAWPLTVEQVAILGRVPHRGWLLPFSAEDRRALDRALAQVELLELRHRPLDTLSGGERRRAQVARALVQDAAILLLDEPGAHLDLRHQVDLFHLLRRLARERGLAVVVTLHDLNLAALFADRVVLLKAGRLLARGTPEEVLTPSLLREAFGLAVEVLPHPRGGARLIVPALPERGD